MREADGINSAIKMSSEKHAPEPATDLWPGGQLVHAEAEEAPTIEEYLPAAQLMHVALPFE